MLPAWIDRGSVNILVINYYTYVQKSGKIGYADTVLFNVQLISKCIAEYLKIFTKYTKKIRLVGHSLGAQIMGSAAKKYKPGVLRLTGTFILKVFFKKCFYISSAKPAENNLIL